MLKGRVVEATNKIGVDMKCNEEPAQSLLQGSQA